MRLLSFPPPPADLAEGYHFASVPSFFVSRAFAHPYLLSELDPVPVDELCCWLATQGAETDPTIVASVVVSLAKRGEPLPRLVPNRDWMVWIWNAAQRAVQRNEIETELRATPP